MKGLIRPDIASLTAYAEELHGDLNLSANTNLFATNPAIGKGLTALRANHLSEYPSLTSVTLQAAVARRHRVDESMVVTGNGSNELIDVVLRTVLSPGDEVAFHAPTFSMIPIFTQVNHGRSRPVALTRDWGLDAPGLLEARGKVTFVVRPNNPTGNAFARRDVERVVREAEGIVVVDEAYAEFQEDASFIDEIRAGNDRLVVLRTLSKAYGLAGFRIGYAVASPALASELNKVRGPFRLNAVSEAIGAVALEDERFVADIVTSIRRERPLLQRALESRGFHVYPSDANFVFTRPPVPARALAAALTAHGVTVRDFGGALHEYLRLTVGPPSATARLTAALDAVIPTLQGAIR